MKFLRKLKECLVALTNSRHCLTIRLHQSKVLVGHGLYRTALLIVFIILKGYNPTTKVIQVATTANQDPLFASTGLVPLLGVDVWEHAYYLQYKNVRPDYLKNIWYVINWDDVSSRFAEAKKLSS